MIINGREYDELGPGDIIIAERGAAPNIIDLTTVWERFTPAEKQALFEYDGPGAWIRGCFLQDLAMYKSVSKDNPRLVDYLDKMEIAGIIAAGRAAEILS